jgi:hypothetical protein
VIDERARLELWQLIASDPREGHMRGWRDRALAQLRRRMIFVPVVLVLSVAAFGTEAAWCAPCKSSASRTAQNQPATVRAPSALAPAPAQPASAAYLGGGRPERHLATRHGAEHAGPGRAARP